MMRSCCRALAWVLIVALALPRFAAAQERGAVALAGLIDGLGVTTRVLMIGAHPDDEDTRLITWLSRGRHVETAYLSLTRGDGGQNLIGNELSEALGAIRTEELLAARRVDGARQFFARAYDFGFSKDSAEALRHWPREELLGDIVTVVRRFRPHVIVSVFSGTSRDGHGQHQVSGLLAQEAYAVSGDTARFPTATYGAAWTSQKLYRATFFDPQSGTYRFNVGAYDPLLGRSYAELAALSRSQHKSQAFGSLQRKGAAISSVRRLASRVNAELPAEREASLFDGVDTTLVRLVDESCGRPRSALDSLQAAIDGAERAFDVHDPVPARRALARVARVFGGFGPNPGSSRCTDERWKDSQLTFTRIKSKLDSALMLSAGVAVEAEVPRELVVLGDTIPVTVRVFNRGSQPVTVRQVHMTDVNLVLAPDSVALFTVPWNSSRRAAPFWLQVPRKGDFFPGYPKWPRRPLMNSARTNCLG